MCKWTVLCMTVDSDKYIYITLYTVCVNVPSMCIYILYIGLPTGLSPHCRPGIGSTHTAALMTCFQMVSFMYIPQLHYKSTSLNLFGAL